MDLHFGGVPFNRILVFPFRDAQSVKRYLVIAGLTLASFLIPILPGLFSAGYSIRILRQAIREGKVEMPEWSDENRLLVDGFYSTIISLVYILPGLLTILAGIVLYMVSFLMMIPILDEADSGSVWLVFIPMIILMVGLMVGLVLFMLGAIPMPVALCRYADEGRLGAAFQIGEIFRSLLKNPVGYLAAWAVSSGLCSFLYIIYLFAYLTIVFCCPGYLLMLIGAAAVGCIFLSMVGLAYREGKTAAKAEALLKSASA